VATCVRRGGIFNNRFTENLQKKQPVKFFENRLRFDRDITMSTVSPFLWNTVYMSVLTWITPPRKGSAVRCDERLCLSVWQFVCPLSYFRKHMSKLHQVFGKRVIWGRGSLLVWRRCDNRRVLPVLWMTSCLPINGPGKGDYSKWLTRGSTKPGGEYDMYHCRVLKCFV